LELQLATLDELVRRGHRLAGWKVAFASGRRPDDIDPSDVAFAFILDEGVQPDRAILKFDQLSNCLVEAEVCLVVGDHSGPFRTCLEAKAAVRALVPAIEINQLRCPPESPMNTVVADGLANWGISIGREVAPQALIKAGGFLRKNDLELSHRHEVDDPYESLRNLSLALDRFGRSIDPGQYILTGSLARDTVGPTDSVSYTAVLDNLGEVSVVLGPATVPIGSQTECGSVL
jgi:2-oxo-hept-3-ene-1,7-dioate hydratase/2-keto-4-pentenoate hydratase